MTAPVIPDKTYFKIGEVARLTTVKTSVLRFWETEFPFLSPEKSSSGQRLYTRQDIERILQIKQLLYHEKYTIEGVRKKIASHRGAKSIVPTLGDKSELLSTLLREVRRELTQIRTLL